MRRRQILLLVLAAACADPTASESTPVPESSAGSPELKVARLTFKAEKGVWRVERQPDDDGVHSAYCDVEKRLRHVPFVLVMREK